MRAELRSLAGFTAIAAHLFFATVGEAQQCSGAGAFSDGRVRIGAAAEMRDEWTRVVGTVALGGSAGFVELAGGIVSYSALSSAGVLAGASGGLEREIGGRLRVCPRVAILAGFGPRGIGGGDVDASTLDAAAGVDVGWPIAVARRVQLVPHAGLSMRWARLALDTGPSGESIGRRDAFGAVEAGVGAIFARRVSVVPRVGINFGALDDGTSISLAIGIATGRGGGS